MVPQLEERGLCVSVGGSAEGHLYALQGAFLQQWRVTASRYQILLVAISQAPTAAAAAWIARASAEQGISLAIAVGTAFVVVWNVTVFRTGFSLLNERWEGTLELNLLSRSPLTLVMLGKSLAFVVFFAMVGLLSFAAVLLVANEVASVDQPVAFALSLTLVVLAVVALQFLFAPLSFLVGAQGLPITHGLNALRGAFTGASVADVSTELLLELAVAAGYALVGLAVFTLMDRAARRRGILAGGEE